MCQPVGRSSMLHFSWREIVRSVRCIYATRVFLASQFKNLSTSFHNTGILWLQCLVSSKLFRPKTVMATDNSGLNSTYLLISEERRKRERRLRARIKGQKQRKGFLWKIYAVSRYLFTDIWSWQSFVSSCYVLTVFLQWIYKMKNSCYQRILLLFLTGLFIGLRRLTKSNWESSFSKFSLLHLAGCVRRLESLKLFWPYLMVFTSCISTGKPE